MDVEEVTTLATTEGENEIEMEAASTTHGGDDLEPEKDSGDKPNQLETSTSNTRESDDSELETDGDKSNRPETLSSSLSRIRQLTFLRDIIPSEIWMRREKKSN